MAEESVELVAGVGMLQATDIVMKYDGTVAMRTIVDYPLQDACKGKYAEILDRFNAAKNKDGFVVVPFPVHVSGTYAFMCNERESDPYWLLLRGYKTLRFNTQFVMSPKHKAFVPAFMYASNNEARMDVPDARLTAPEGFRYVVILSSRINAGMYLYGIREKDAAVFRVPLPNTTFETGHLCEGTGIRNKYAALNNARCHNISLFADLLTAWESAQWNADLTASLPLADRDAFLKWDIKGTHLATTATWNKLAEAYNLGLYAGISASAYTSLLKYDTVCKVYMRETDNAIYNT